MVVQSDQRRSAGSGAPIRSCRANLLRSRLEQALGSPFTDGNSIQTLRNGDEIFPAMLRAIAESRESIEFLTFVYWSGDIADRFAESLAERAKVGVAVRVLLDSFGAAAMPRRLVRSMRQAGAEILWFRPLLKLKPWTWNNRTHRKVLVCDGEVAFTGGVGIAEEWEGDAQGPKEWRDTHFRFTGPSVSGLRAAFWGNWIEAGGRIPARLLDEAALRTERLHGSTAPRDSGHSDDAAVQIVRSTAAIGWNDVATVVRVLIDSAERRLAVSTAYFSPDATTTAHLRAAVERGVDVTILIPGKHADKRVSQLASARQLKRLLRTGVRLWRFDPTMLHTKIMLIDDVAASIGSANFNQRSLCKDDEVCAVVIHRETTDQLRQHLEEDLARSEPVTPSQFASRGLIRRIREKFAMMIKGNT